MDNKSNSGNRMYYFIAAAVTAILTLIFKFISVGMGFTALCMLILTLLLVFFGILGGGICRAYL